MIWVLAFATLGAAFATFAAAFMLDSMAKSVAGLERAIIRYADETARAVETARELPPSLEPPAVPLPVVAQKKKRKNAAASSMPEKAGEL